MGHFSTAQDPDQVPGPWLFFQPQLSAARCPNYRGLLDRTGGMNGSMSMSHGFSFGPGLILSCIAICIALSIALIGIAVSDEIQLALRKIRHAPHVVLWLAVLTISFILLPIIAIAWAKVVIN